MTEAHPTPTDEIAYLNAYEAAVLWKPQVVADNVLNGIFLADSTYRAALAGLLLQESVEAARRLAAVWGALADRSQPVARRLAGPLPGAEEWQRLVEFIETVEAPEQVISHLSLDTSALDSAGELMKFLGLRWFIDVIRTAESGPPAVSVEPGLPATLVWSGYDRAGVPFVTRLLLEDDQVIALGDATGDMVTWAREFLGAYIDARTAGAG